MRRQLELLVALLLIVAIGLGAAALILLFQISSAVKHADDAVNGTLAGLNGVVAKAGVTLDQVNRPCGAKVQGREVPCGTLATVNKAVVDMGDVTIATQIRSGRLIAHSSELLDRIAVDVHGEMAEAQRATQGVTAATRQAQELLQASKADMLSLQPALTALPPVLAAAAKTTQDVDGLVMSPDVLKTLGNVQRTTASSAAVIEDARIEADKFAHPNRKKAGFWATADGTVLWFHSHVMPPIF